MLVLSRKPGQRLVLTIGRYRATIKVLTASSGRVRVGVDAPAAMQVIREEICGETGAVGNCTKRHNGVETTGTGHAWSETT